MICDGCKSEVPSNVKFCPACGKAVAGPNPAPGAVRCSKCGAVYPEGTRFCRADGQPLQAAAAPPADADRKPAATAPVAPLPIPPAAATAPPVKTAGAPPAGPAPRASAPAAPPPAAKAASPGPASQAVVIPQKAPLVVYGVALVVLVVVGCLVWFLLRPAAPPTTPEQASITEGGEQPGTAAPAETESPEAAAPPKGPESRPAESRPAAPVMVVPEQPRASEAEPPRQEQAAVAEPAPQAIPPCVEDICIEVANAVCSPGRAAPGAEVRCAATYTLVQSRDPEPIEIEESAHLDGARKATATQRVQKTSGRNRLAITFVVPKGTKPGAHQVTLKARRRGVTGSAIASLAIE